MRSDVDEIREKLIRELLVDRDILGPPVDRHV